MSQPPNSSVLLIGGPDAGKSNFLFRFWLAVDGGHGAMIKNGFPDELEYLRDGSESLLGGAFAGRTSGDVLEHASIPVKLAAKPELAGILNVPDLPGEKILEVYRMRQWDDSWEDRIERDCGCLVFVRAGSTETVSPLDYDACLRAFGAPLQAAQGRPLERLATTAPGVVVPEPEKDPDPPGEGGNHKASRAAPTDVVLTDWLQFLRSAFTDRVGGAYRPRVGLIIAAWDALPADQQDVEPAEYLKENFPLIAQFVDTNGDRFDFQIFGLSILSGDLKENPQFRAKFLAGRTDDFGYVIHSLAGDLEKVTDVTLPVAWALGWHAVSTLKESP